MERESSEAKPYPSLMSAVPQKISRLRHEILLWGSLVKFSHSIFAMPFALSMFVVVSFYRSVSVWQLIWIVAALVGARTAAMGFNRILDRHLDALNPRTKDRELPANKIPLASALNLVIISSVIFFVAASMLGVHCLYLAPLVLAILFFYSYTKRFTSYAHLVLGLSLALAPGGVWYALTAEWAWQPLLMMAAVMLWVAGFDIIYSCQDADFDRSYALHSIPARLGIKRALFIAKIFHGLTVVFLALFGAVHQFGAPYFTGLLIFSLLLLNQHTLVKPDDLSKADAAFFSRNAAASFVFFLAVVVERLAG